MKNVYVLLKTEAGEFADLAEISQEMADQAEADLIDYMWLKNESPYIAY